MYINDVSLKTVLKLIGAQFSQRSLYSKNQVYNKIFYKLTYLATWKEVLYLPLSVCTISKSASTSHGSSSVQSVPVAKHEKKTDKCMNLL